MEEKQIKTADKVFIVIGMIVGAIGILSVIFGAIAFSMMKTAACADVVKAWAIVDIFFCNIYWATLFFFAARTRVSLLTTDFIKKDFDMCCRSLSLWSFFCNGTRRIDYQTSILF